MAALLLLSLQLISVLALEPSVSSFSYAPGTVTKPASTFTSNFDVTPSNDPNTYFFTRSTTVIPEATISWPTLTGAYTYAPTSLDPAPLLGFQAALVYGLPASAINLVTASAIGDALQSMDSNPPIPTVIESFPVSLSRFLFYPEWDGTTTFDPYPDEDQRTIYLNSILLGLDPYTTNAAESQSSALAALSPFPALQASATEYMAALSTWEPPLVMSTVEIIRTAANYSGTFTDWVTLESMVFASLNGNTSMVSMTMTTATTPAVTGAGETTSVTSAGTPATSTKTSSGAAAPTINSVMINAQIALAGMAALVLL